MLDSLLRATEKAIQLFEYRDKRKRLRFDTFVAPLYKSLQDVHGDYLKMFDTLLRGLREGGELLGLAGETYTQGLTFEPARKDLAAKIKVYSRTVTEMPFAAFLVAAGNYLTPPRGGETLNAVAAKNGLAISSVRTMLVVAIVRAQEDEARERWLSLSPAQRRLTIDFVEMVAAESRKKWDRVAEAHAAAQLDTAP